MSKRRSWYVGPPYNNECAPVTAVWQVMDMLLAEAKKTRMEERTSQANIEAVRGGARGPRL